MFVTIPKEILYTLPNGVIRIFHPGDVVNEGKYPGLMAEIEKATKAPRDKMVRGAANTKAATHE